MIVKNFNYIKQLNFLRTSDCFTNFDGTNDYINVSNNLSISSLDWNQTFSFFVWIYKPSLNLQAPIVGNWINTGGWFFSVLGTNPAFPTFTRALRFQFRTSSSGIAGTIMDAYSQIKITNDVWQMIGVTNDGLGLSTSLNFYVNGILSAQPHTFTQGSFINTGTSINAQPMVIGALLNAVQNYADMNLQHLSYYNTELTPADAISLYNQGRISPNYSNFASLVSHYPLTRYDFQDRIGGTFGTPSGMNPSNIICN